MFTHYKRNSSIGNGLKQIGANIFLCSANPLSTQEHIVSLLKQKEIIVYGKEGETL